jgi:hypothetical protein
LPFYNQNVGAVYRGKRHGYGKNDGRGQELLLKDGHGIQEGDDEKAF